jgi:hypothetical protein
MPAYWLCRASPLARRPIWLNQRKMLKKWCRRWCSNPWPDRRRAGDTRWNCLTSRTSCSDIFNIEYKLYICIYVFCKIKIYNHVGPGQHYGPRLQPSTVGWPWLSQALGHFWNHIGAMDYMVFQVAELDGATMICHTNTKIKGYLLVLNVSNCYEVA